MSVAAELKAAGFSSTAWLDRNTGEEKRGTLDPNNAEPEGRYGVALADVKGWPAHNYAGTHSAGDNVNLFAEDGVTFLAAKILGVEPSASDLDDVRFVDGAAQYLLRLGREKGIIKPTEQPVPGGGGQVNDKAAVALKAINERAQAALRAFPQGGGAPAHALRDLATFIAAQAKAVGA